MKKEKAPKLPDGEVSELLLYQWVREIADEYGLRDWTIETKVKALKATAEAEFKDGPWVTIAFGEKAFRSPEYLRVCVLHELSHCHATRFHTLARSHRGLARKLCHDAEEWTVDAIALAIAKFFPLPPQDLFPSDPRERVKPPSSRPSKRNVRTGARRPSRPRKKGKKG